MILRPYGVVVEGKLELGLELEVQNSGKHSFRPHTGIPEPYIVSPAFFNAHSHLEYRGLINLYGTELPYWPWIRELTRLKAGQQLREVEAHVQHAAKENRATGVQTIWEHSDRPFAAKAMSENGLDGIVFQELITFLEQESPATKRANVEERAQKQRMAGRLPVYVTPHAPFTVDRGSLMEFGASNEPFSIHVAETEIENLFYKEGAGPIADLYRSAGFDFEPFGGSVIDYVEALGLLRPGAQFVHVCDVEDRDIARISEAEVSVAHCPRSNIRLGSPICPVRRMLEAGVDVNLGLDSPASGGKIDFFEEMRATLLSSIMLREPLKPEQVWKMATSRQSDWIKIHVAGVHTTEELIERATSNVVEWVNAEVSVKS